ncbi:hypothetical protein ABZY68_10525 [Streptomyces sp. NPDC006482]|uniref:hypothetical protein n=1 Tax=Streptomyces sp. NPDC006482 TaxID=3154306 RepID=UPI0033BA3D3B
MVTSTYEVQPVDDLPATTTYPPCSCPLCLSPEWCDFHGGPSQTAEPVDERHLACTQWCQERYGRYIHHAPASRYRDTSTMVDVTGRIRAHGYIVDDSLWGTKAECNDPACCGDGGC